MIGDRRSPTVSYHSHFTSHCRKVEGVWRVFGSGRSMLRAVAATNSKEQSILSFASEITKVLLPWDRESLLRKHREKRRDRCYNSSLESVYSLESGRSLLEAFVCVRQLFVVGEC